MQPLCVSGKTTICIANVLPQRMHFMNETNTETQHVRGLLLIRRHVY